MNYWPPDDGRATFDAEKALLEMSSGRQCSAAWVFLGTGADYQPGSIGSSDCFGNVSNVSQNGRLVKEGDRTSCWAMAIMNLWLNGSFHDLLAHLYKEWKTHPSFTQIPWWRIPSLLGTRTDTHLWQGAVLCPALLRIFSCSTCCLRGVLVIFCFFPFFPSTDRILEYPPIFFSLMAGRKNEKDKPQERQPQSVLGSWKSRESSYAGIQNTKLTTDVAFCSPVSQLQGRCFLLSCTMLTNWRQDVLAWCRGPGSTRNVEVFVPPCVEHFTEPSCQSLRRWEMCGVDEHRRGTWGTRDSGC